VAESPFLGNVAENMKKFETMLRGPSTGALM
jgi:hypothetical protein